MGPHSQTRQWDPHRLTRRRRRRVLIASLLVVIVAGLSLGLGLRKSVALEVNGSTRYVTTYASSLDRFLQEQGISLKSHDQVTSTSGPWLQDKATVNVRQAYQVTLDVNGVQVPYWTVAKSAGQLASFFENAQKDAAKVTVDIPNIYNQLTGGLVINQAGPVTVEWDGQRSIAPDGRLTAASILDSKGISLGKDDLVSVLREGTATILRVQRVTFGMTTAQVSIPFQTITVKDPDLDQGLTQVRQPGADGVRTDSLRVTYVDGQASAQTLVRSLVTSQPVSQVVAVGTKVPTTPTPTPADGSGAKPNTPEPTTPPATGGQGQAAQGKSQDNGRQASGGSDPAPAGEAGTPAAPQPTQTPAPAAPAAPNPASKPTPAAPSPTPTPTPQPKPTPKPSAPSPAPASSLHLSPAEAQSLAQGIARDLYGWGADQFSCLVTLWNNESGWRWDADNPWSDAYGIPQALPGSKMGAGWHDDASVQIQWGLSYIRNRYDYGSPCKALQLWQARSPHWY